MHPYVLDIYRDNIPDSSLICGKITKLSIVLTFLIVRLHVVILQ